MPHVPRSICGKCLIEMTAVALGHTLTATTDGRPYYAVDSDLYACPECGATAYVGFGSPIHRPKEVQGIPFRFADEAK